MNTIYSTAPEVKQIALAGFPSYSGKMFRVKQFVPLTLESTWAGGCRDYYAFVNLATMQAVSVPENGNPFLDVGTFKCSKLPDNIALLRHVIYSGKDLGIEIMVNTENLAKLLPAPVELTMAQKIVLAFTAQRKSSYNGKNRAQMALEDVGLPVVEFEQAKAEMIARGLLNSAGAINNEGRNAVSGISNCDDLKVLGFSRFGITY